MNYSKHTDYSGMEFYAVELPKISDNGKEAYLNAYDEIGEAYMLTFRVSDGKQYKENRYAGIEWIPIRVKCLIKPDLHVATIDKDFIILNDGSKLSPAMWNGESWIDGNKKYIPLYHHEEHGRKKILFGVLIRTVK